MTTKNSKAKLILEDGSTFEGESFGYEESIAGEVVFSTGMVGYPESLTDPSYKGQILVLTYPLIGNYGIPPESEKKLPDNFESSRIQVSALIVSEYSKEYHHYSSNRSLMDWLKEHKIPALTKIDTRALTRKIREKGVMLGKIIIEEKDVPLYDPNQENLVAKVSISEPVEYGSGKHKIILIDCGMKNNILRLLLKRDVTVRRVPWNYDFTGEDFDGLFISNGPGDPKLCQRTISLIKKTMDMDKPIFGICLGNQLLGLAAGGDTYKLKYGHRSQNQPAEDLFSGSCFITSQNHGYALDMKSLETEWDEFYQNINDGTNEGIIHKTKPWFSVQFHPEGSSGPQDTESLFDKFIENIEKVK